MRAVGNKERRKYFRHPAQIPIVCRCKEHLEPHQGELRDIGCGGMAFVSSSTFQPGDVISVEYPTVCSRAARNPRRFIDVLRGLPDLNSMHEFEFSRKQEMHMYKATVSGRNVWLKRRDTPRALVLYWACHDRFFMKWLGRDAVGQMGPKTDQKEAFRLAMARADYPLEPVQGTNPGGHHKGYFLFRVDGCLLQDRAFLKAVDRAVGMLVRSTVDQTASRHP